MFAPGQVPYTLRVCILTPIADSDPALLAAAADLLIARITATLSTEGKRKRSWSTWLANLLDRPATVVPPAGTPLYWQVTVAGPGRVARPLCASITARLGGAVECLDTTEAAVADEDAGATLSVEPVLDLDFPEQVIERFGPPQRRRMRRAIESAELVLLLAPVADPELRSAVEYALELGRAVLTPDEQPGECCRLLLPEPGATLPQPIPVPFPAQAEQLSRGYHELSAYNRTLPEAVRAQEAKAIATIRARLCGADRCMLRDEDLGPALDVILPHYVRADLLAGFFQRKHLRVTQWLYWLGAGAVTVAIGQSVFFPQWPQLVLLEVLALLLALAWHRWSHIQDWHEKWLNDRFLAERFRHMIFTCVLAPPPGNLHASQRLLAFYRGPETWLQDYPLRLEQEAHRLVPTQGSTERVREFLVTQWIQDQAQHHQWKARISKQREDSWHRVGLALFFTTVFAASAHLAFPHLAERFHWSHELEESVSPWLLFLAVSLPAVGGALQAVRNQLELPRLSSRSKRMAHELRLLGARMREARSMAEIRMIAVEAQAKMGVETHEWWVLLGFRDPSLPA